MLKGKKEFDNLHPSGNSSVWVDRECSSPPGKDKARDDVTVRWVLRAPQSELAQVTEAFLGPGLFEKDRYQIKEVPIHCLLGYKNTYEQQNKYHSR